MQQDDTGNATHMDATVPAANWLGCTDRSKVTPAPAYARAYESDMISLKHDWYIYADSRYDYAHDVYLGSSIGRAHNQGVRIDGQTGWIVQ